ncbi:hypothetical protein K7432_001462 [Basidiobolus ranarum]|uniref:C3H1-type domain-containing protein n=1 Tax=Basidiobolus ranarum TaxID=34480 RepID=A0ABR2W9L3_9FUNG
MSSDKELLEQIALLAGAINKHKMQMEGNPASRFSYSVPSSPRKNLSYSTKPNHYNSGNNSIENTTTTEINPNYIRKGNKLVRLNEDNSQVSLDTKRVLYAPPNGHMKLTGNRHLSMDKSQAQIPVSRHRKLVVQPVSNSTETPTNPDSQQSGWVQKRSRHMQLINAAVHAKRTEEMNRSKPNIINLTPKGTSVLIDGTKYRRGPSGNKLVIAKEGVSGNEVTVDGVVFVMDQSGQRLIRKKQDVLSKRTRSGNLVAHKNPTQQHYKHRYSTKQLSTSGDRSKYCQYFNRFGRCSKGTKCPFIHDPQRVAICTKFLRGACKDEECPFSHNITPERVPLCYHFQKGKCTNQDCPYLHVKVNPDAPVCKAFMNEGFCPNGKSCKERHVWECADFSANGICENMKCKLPHVARGNKRNSAQSSNDSVADQEDDETPKEAEYKIQPHFTDSVSDLESDQEEEELTESEYSS